MAAVSKLIDALEEHEDVKEVYTNAEFSDTPELRDLRQLEDTSLACRSTIPCQRGC